MPTRSASSVNEPGLDATEAIRGSELAIIDLVRHLQRRREAESEREACERLEAQLTALIEVAATVAASHQLKEVLELCAEQALRASNAASVSITRWYPEQGLARTLINVGELGPGEERWPEDEIYFAEDFPGWHEIFQGVPQIAVVDDPESDPAQRKLLKQLRKESSIGVAIRFGGEVWGELWATTGIGARRFTAEDLLFLQAIAAQMGAAIGRAELFDRIAHLAYRDPLTDLSNRRALDEALERALDGSPTEPVALLVCDVDGLKAVNDRDGHHAGDQLLIRVAEALQLAAGAHPDTLVCRLGGDEFCVLLEHGGLAAAGAIARDAGRRLRPVTVSCGAAEAVTSTPAALLRAADAAQYHAKQRGPGLFSTASTAVGAPVPASPGRRAHRDLPK